MTEPDRCLAGRGWRRGCLGIAIGFLALVLALSIGLAVWAWRDTVLDPVVRRLTVVYRAPALSHRSLRIALLSDIHVGNPGMTPARLGRVVANVNAEHPDAVLMAGDFVNGRAPDDPETHPDQLIEPLRHLSAPLGVFAVLGNHDHETNPEAVRAALEAAGVTVLVNRAVPLGPVMLAGLDNFAGPGSAMQAALNDAGRPGGVVISMIHVPSELAPDHTPVLSGDSLGLAGHTHCGQVVLPGVPTGIAPLTGRPIYDLRYRCGLIRDRNRLILVTGGVGTGSFPFRIGAPSDFWIVTLKGAGSDH